MKQYKTRLTILLCLVLLMVLYCAPPPANAFDVSPWQRNVLSEVKYDISFRKHTSIYLPRDFDWKLLKAQCFQESAFREDAVSPVGAKGLCQFMPATWDEQTRTAGITGHPFNYDLNIQMAAQYMSRLISGWSSPRPRKDQFSLALASYNAGFGNILNSQKECNNATLYNEIMVCLPCITGRHSRETNQYVFRIWAFYNEQVKQPW